MFRRNLLFTCFILLSIITEAQKIDSIYVNLYTDSLKIGTYNYINVDGKLSNGRFTPLDSTDLIFWSNEGKFHGNSLWLGKDFGKEKVKIKVTLRKNSFVSKEFTMYIKKNPDDERLKTSDEIMNEINNRSKKTKRNK